MNMLKAFSTATVFLAGVTTGVIAYRRGCVAGKIQLVEDSRTRALQECKESFLEQRKVLWTKKGMYTPKDFASKVTDLELQEQEEYVTINEEFDAVIKQLSE